MRRAAAALALVAVAAVLPAACGDDHTISDTAAAQLQPKVTEIRELVDDRQPEQAAVRLAELRTAVETLRQQGEIDAQRADEVLAAVAEVEQQLGSITTTTTVTTTTTAPAPPSTSSGPNRDRDRDDDKGKSESDDRGNGKD